MANNITNRLEIIGPESEILEVNLKILNKDVTEFTQKPSIDFNKIIPQPEGIYLEDLSLEDREKHPLNWYDWNIKNWGTKWNAYNQMHNKNLFNVLYFQTAWNNVLPVIKALSEMYSKLIFHYSFYDEDLGHNLGVFILQGGQILQQYFPSEATQQANDLIKQIGSIYNDKLYYTIINEELNFIDRDTSNAIDIYLPY